MAATKPGPARKSTRRGRPTSRTAVEAGNSTVLVGLRLLQVIAESDEPETLTQIAKRSGLSVSRAFRYLRSLTQAEFLRHDAETGKYTIGPAAVELGLAAMSKLDEARLASDVMRELVNATKMVSTLSVWGSNGPTVLRSEHGNLDVTVRVREGTTLSLPITAVGRVFHAYMPTGETRDLLKRDLAAWNAGKAKDERITLKTMEATREAVRRQGLSHASGLRNPAMTALAAPVFGRQGELRMCLALIGISSVFDTDSDGGPARALKSAADRLSRLIGGVRPAGAA